MRVFGRLSLSTRLTILAVATLFPLAILVVLNNFENRRERRDAGLAEATSNATGAASALQGFARNLDSFLDAAALVLGANDQPLTQEAAGPQLRSLSPRNANVSALFITDLQGRIQASSADGSLLGQDLSQHSYIHSLRSGLDSVWSATGSATTADVIATYGRTISDPNGMPKAYLVAAFDPTALIETLLEDLPDDANFVLIDQNGQLIFSARDERLERTEVLIGDSPLVQTALDGRVQRIDSQSTPFDEGARFGALAPIQTMGWAVGYTRSQDILDNGLRSDLLRDLGAVTLIMLLTVLALTIVSRQITRPLAMLARAAAALGSGRRMDVGRRTSDPDIASLQQAFSRMSDSVARREQQLLEQAQLLGSLEEAAASIASDLDFEKTVRAITDIGSRLTESTRGAFFFQTAPDEPYRLFAEGSDTITLSTEAVNVLIASMQNVGSGALRMADATRAQYTERIGRMFNSEVENGNGAREPVKSVLAVPVYTGQRRLIGGLIFGHTEAAFFTEMHERLALGIASWAGIALDNARLYAESQEAQAELREAARAKDDFLGIVSHELRTPITTIYGGARLLGARRHQLASENADELISDIEQESERLYRLVQNLLVLARSERRAEVEKEPVSLPQLIQKLMATFARRRPNRNVEVHMQPGAEIAWAEDSYLDQILLNLVTNADKYSPMDQTIEIDVSIEGEEQVFRVLDRGPGVSENEIDRIFESFFRSSTTAASARGTGVGLAVCRRLVEAQGGRIWAKLRPGGGLEVGFALPVLVDVEVPV
ncbi:MAG TPA: ATP-binding protein [Dehalococcoidia bacterium]|nr:ATP-binding protein [Dehalococcoidia bacterium]